MAVPCQSSCCKLPAATYLRPWLGLRAASWAKRERERRKKDAQTDANFNNIFILFFIVFFYGGWRHHLAYSHGLRPIATQEPATKLPLAAQPRPRPFPLFFFLFPSQPPGLISQLSTTFSPSYLSICFLFLELVSGGRSRGLFHQENKRTYSANSRLGPPVLGNPNLLLPTTIIPPCQTPPTFKCTLTTSALHSPLSSE